MSAVPRKYYVYVMASERQTVYTGVTSHLESRVWQHKSKLVPAFTAKYDCTKLVYYEVTNDVWEAIGREKVLRMTRKVLRMTRKALRITSKALRMTI